MLERTTRTVAALLVAVAAVVAAWSMQSFDLQAAAATLPDLPSASGGRGVSSLDGFDAPKMILRDAMLEPNAERLEAELDATVVGFGSGPAGRSAPTGLAGLGAQPALLRARRALDGIPGSELEVATFVREPSSTLEPWRVEVVIDVRAVAGNAPGFRSPSTSLTLELRPYGHAGSRIVERWAVQSAQFRRGGVLALAPDITYVRRGGIAVAASSGDAALARESADYLHGILPVLQRRYSGLSRSKVAFVVLAPSRAAAAEAFAWEDAEMDGAIGYAKGSRHMAVLVSEMRLMDDLGRRDLLRHELTHLATSRLTSTGWSTYVEGLAEWEGNHEIVADGTFFIINGPAVDLVDAGKVDVDQLLFGRRSFDQFGDDAYQGYRLGMLVTDYLKSVHGEGRSLRFYRAIAAGTPPRTAVRRVLGMSPAQYRTEVLAWMRTHRDWD